MSMKQYIEMGKAEGIVSEQVNFEEAFRKYSEAMKLWFQGFIVPRTNGNIKCEVIYASPNFATALRGATSHAEKPEVNRDVTQKLIDLREDRTKIPIIAFTISSMNFLMDFELPAHIWYRTQDVDPSRKEAEMKRKDLPYQLQFTASVWTKTKVDMNYLMQQILSQFGPDYVFIVENQEVSMHLESITDTSVLEAGTTGQYQLIRHDLVFTMKQVWIRTNTIKVKNVLYQKMAYSERPVDPLHENDMLITSTQMQSDFKTVETVVDKSE